VLGGIDAKRALLEREGVLVECESESV